MKREKKKRKRKKERKRERALLVFETAGKRQKVKKM